MPDAQTITDYLLDISPPWLLRKWGRRFLLTLGVYLDAHAQAALEALQARFLPIAPADALPVAGEDRLIDRLVGEIDDSYRRRLLQAFPSRRQGGSARGLENRLHEAGHTTASVVEAHDWSVDDGGPWGRYWVVLQTPNGLTAPEAWDTASTWGDGSVWSDMTPQTTVDEIRRLARLWGSGAHAEGVSLIVVTSGELWDSPTGIWSDAGTWGGDAAYVSLA